MGVQEGHKGSEKEIRTPRTTAGEGRKTATTTVLLQVNETDLQRPKNKLRMKEALSAPTVIS